MIKKFTLLIIILISLFVGCNSNEKEENLEWPNKPITIITPWAVGGLADQATRAIAQYGHKHSSEPIVPTNRTGAGGVVALTEFLREKPNSHNLTYSGEGPFAISPLFNELPYSWEDFTPIINIYTSSLILVANPKLGINSFEDLKEYGKNNKVILGVSGVNSTEYLMGAALLTEMNIEYEGVSFNGANEAMNSTVSGDTLFSITHGSLAKEFVKSGQLNPVLVFDEVPLEDDVYNLQPVTKYGYDTFFLNRCIMYMRAGTDQEVINKAHDIMYSTLQDPEFVEVAKNIGLVLDPIGPEECREYIEESVEKANRFYEIITN